MGHSVADIRPRLEVLPNDNHDKQRQCLYQGDLRNLEYNKQWDSSKDSAEYFDGFAQFVVDGGYTVEELYHGFKGPYIQNHRAVSASFDAPNDADKSQQYRDALAFRPNYPLSAPQNRLPTGLTAKIDIPPRELWLANDRKTFHYWFPRQYHYWDQHWRFPNGTRKPVPPLYAPRWRSVAPRNVSIAIRDVVTAVQDALSTPNMAPTIDLEPLSAQAYAARNIFSFMPNHPAMAALAPMYPQPLNNTAQTQAMSGQALMCHRRVFRMLLTTPGPQLQRCLLTRRWQLRVIYRRQKRPCRAPRALVCVQAALSCAHRQRPLQRN